MKRSGGVTTSPEYDAHLNGKATPGTHTDCKEVPIDEIQRPDGKILKGNTVSEEKQLTEVEVRWKQAYDLCAEGFSWKEIAEKMEVKLNQSWMFVGKHCKRLGIENPSKKKQPAKPAPKAVEAPAPPAEEVIQEPLSVSETRILTEGDTGFVKTSKGHTHTAIVQRDGREFSMAFASHPRERDIARAIRNQFKL